MAASGLSICRALDPPPHSSVTNGGQVCASVVNRCAFSANDASPDHGKTYRGRRIPRNPSALL
jgi:hypothetical protein